MNRHYPQTSDGPTGSRVRTLDLSDLTTCLEVAAEAGWPPETEKWRFYLDVGQGFGLEMPDGTLAGTVIAFDYGPDATFVGMLAVRRRFRRHGYARRLMEHVLQRYRQGPVLLYSTREGRPFYDALGFREVDRLVPHLLDGDPHDPSGGIKTPIRDLPPSQHTVQDLGADEYRRAWALDRRAFGAPRDRVLGPLFGHTLSARAAADPTDPPGDVRGFAAAWRNLDMIHIGPVVAQDETIALGLMADLLDLSSRASRGRDTVRIDVPAGKSQVRTWLEAQGFASYASVPLLIRGADQPPGESALRFAVAAQALG